MPKKEYSRKITLEEAKDNKILIEKKAVKLFPSSGEKFRLIFGRTHVETEVEAIDCQCGKKKKPHQHYYLKIPAELPIRVNEKVTITKITDENYQLTK
ncbi:MAG: hypothetical protein ACTSRW_15190 [Candidatus Helarchaeota archaeon]